MTAREFVHWLGQYPIHATVFLVVVPVVAALAGAAHSRGKGGQSPWKYLYTALVYLACVPGVLAAVLTGYAVFFTRENLLDVNLLVYILPIISMTATLVLISKNVSFDEVPGFDRLSGLMVIIAITFVCVLAIQKTFIWVFFGGSILFLIGLAVGLFALLKWGAYMLFRRKDEPPIKPPSLNFPR